MTTGLAYSVSAAPSYNWNGSGDASTWSQGANWVGGVAPTPDTFRIFLGTGYPTVTPTPINLASTDTVQLSDSVFGPEWGETLNIYGKLIAGFGIVPVGAIGGPTSTVNMYANSSPISAIASCSAMPGGSPAAPTSS